MPLGFLAKDSIADLQAFASRQETATVGSSNENGRKISGDETADASPEATEPFTANPQQAQEEDHPIPAFALGTPQPEPRTAMAPASSSRPSPSTTPLPSEQHPSHYSGFETYSKEFYFHDSYSSMYLGEKNQTENKGFWSCIFPCMKPQTPMHPPFDYHNEFLQSNEVLRPLTPEAYPNDVLAATSPYPDEGGRSITSRDDDEVSTNSDVLGERLSEKERQAVLARLRLAQPDAAEASNSSLAAADVEELNTGEGGSSSSYAKSPLSQRGLLNGIPAYDTSPLLSPDDVFPALPPKLTRPVKGILKRRSTCTSKDASAIAQGQKQGSLSAGMTSQQSSRRFLFPSYESNKPRKVNAHVSFAPMARVVTVKSKNDMTPEEKGDIWFQKQDYEDFRKTGRIITKAMLQGGSEIWLTSSLKPPTVRSSSPGGVATNQEDNKENPNSTLAPGEKWWHKFGHSRRGLEHIVSFEEGRQRQTNVRNAIHAVLEEQARQRRYRREDPEKLRIVSLNNTNWARDLALAAGASDADAVQCAFAEDRKSREFYLLKMSRTDPAQTTRRIPEFMQPAAHSHLPTSPRPNTAMKAQRLDENTAAQIRYRHDQSRQDGASPATTMSVTSASSEESSEPIRDPNPDEKKTSSMAQRAKGFISEGAGKVDMSAVLSGLGAVPQESAAVTT